MNLIRALRYGPVARSLKPFTPQQALAPTQGASLAQAQRRQDPQSGP